MSGVKIEVRAIDFDDEKSAIIYLKIDGEMFVGHITSLNGCKEKEIDLTNHYRMTAGYKGDEKE